MPKDNQIKIKELETISGIKAHTIRIWEQRYQFLKPSRTATNMATLFLGSMGSKGTSFVRNASNPNPKRSIDNTIPSSTRYAWASYNTDATSDSKRA